MRFRPADSNATARPGMGAMGAMLSRRMCKEEGTRKGTAKACEQTESLGVRHAFAVFLHGVHSLQIPRENMTPPISLLLLMRLGLSDAATRIGKGYGQP